MKKLLYLTILFFTLTNIVFGQEFRSYDLGTVSYEDFKADVLDIEDSIGEIYFDYRSQPKTIKIEGSDMSYSILEVGINTEQSWLDISRASKFTLDYFQVLFAIEHFYAERYNAAFIDSWTSRERVDIEKLKSDKSIELSKFKKESQNGLREDIIQKWKDRLTDQIASLGQGLPDLRLVSTGGIDFHIGYAYNLKGGTFEQAFGNSHGIGMGFNFYYKQNALILSGVLGFHKLGQNLTDRPFWEENINVTSALFNIAYGREIRIANIVFTPFVGPTVHDIYINKNEFEGVYSEIRNTSWTIGGGVLVDIPFFSRVYSNTSNYNRWNGLGEQGIRLGIHYIAPVDHFDGTYEGSNISFSLNYYIRLGTVKLVER